MIVKLGGGQSGALAALSDVAVDQETLAGGDIIQYDAEAGVWRNVTDDGTVVELSGLTDVSVDPDDLVDGQVLRWNGTVWVADVIDLGTDTTGNYVSGLTAGTGVTVTHTPGEGSSPTVAIGQSVATTANPEFAGVTADAIRVGITAANEIDTAVGQLVIDSFSGTTTIDDNLIVTGNLTISGTTTTVNTQTLNVADNIVTLNSDVTGPPTENSGIEINRGTSATVAIRWNEVSDRWEFTEDGTTYKPLGGSSGSAVQSAFTSPYSYIGVAPAGTSSASPLWRIRRIQITTGYPVTTATAVAWNDRLTASYS